MEEKYRSEEWNVAPSSTSNQTFNPIRAIVDEMKINPNPNKEMIALSLGDPTVFGNFKPADSVLNAVVDAINNGSYNGYGPSFGLNCARDAIAEYVSREGAEVNEGDVYLASGCSDALGLAMTVLASPGDNILVPCPGFSLYKTLCLSQGIGIKLYRCLPEREWEVDTEHIKELVDSRTKAIVVVNPSNPCGSNFSKQHICDILKVASNYKLPVIADEIYADIVFNDQKFYSCAELSDDVPVLSCGGIAKRFLVPGWRLGWVVVHDKHQVLGNPIRDGLVKLTQRILGPCTLIQAALPAILNTPQAFHDETVRKIAEGADLVYQKLKSIKGLRPVKPSAAMYMMVGFDRDHFKEFENDLHFTERLISEQSVFCLPATCFEYPNYFRVVLTVPREKTIEACDRIEEFCNKHYQ